MAEANPESIRLLIVDDHAMVREGLLAFLDLHDEIEVVGEAANGAEAIHLAEKRRPHVVLMDLVMPSVDGIQATKTIAERFPEIKVIALTSFGEDERVIGAIRAGAVGYLLKNVSPPHLVRAIEDVFRGDVHLHSAVSRTILDRIIEPQAEVSATVLTRREREVLALLAEGQSNKEIALALGIVVKTVKVHVSNILKKLGVADRTQAAVTAIRKGWVNSEGG